VNPIQPPRYKPTSADALLAIEVEAADWPSLLSAAALAVSDAIHPLGDFQTWTARRVTARGATNAAMLERWVATLLDDVNVSGFLPALVEIERTEPGRIAGVHRGGCVEEAGATHRFRGVVPGASTVTPGGDGEPWRACLVLETV
jgi:SHS2 domain-containing protein